MAQQRRSCASRRREWPCSRPRAVFFAGDVQQLENLTCDFFFAVGDRLLLRRFSAADRGGAVGDGGEIVESAAVARPWATTRVAPTTSVDMGSPERAVADMRPTGRSEQATAGVEPSALLNRAPVGATLVVALAPPAATVERCESAAVGEIVGNHKAPTTSPTTPVPAMVIPATSVPATIVPVSPVLKPTVGDAGSGRSRTSWEVYAFEARDSGSVEAG